MEAAETSHRRRVHSDLLQRMNEVQTTQLIVGYARKPLWYTLFKESAVHYLLRNARHMDMLIVADFDHDVGEKAPY
ncbi:hypothetical protein D3C76_1523850 [compost metagenome]